MLWMSQHTCSVNNSHQDPDDEGREPSEIWTDWMSANKVGDAERASICAEEMTRAAPDSFYA